MVTNHVSLAPPQYTKTHVSHWFCHGKNDYHFVKVSPQSKVAFWKQTGRIRSLSNTKTLKLAWKPWGLEKRMTYVEGLKLWWDLNAIKQCATTLRLVRLNSYCNQWNCNCWYSCYYTFQCKRSLQLWVPLKPMQEKKNSGLNRAQSLTSMIHVHTVFPCA